MDNPDQHIANLRNGAQAGFKYFQLGEANKLAVKTRGDGGKFVVSIQPEGTPCGEINFEKSISWQESGFADVTLPQGVHALYFTYHGDGSVDFMSFTLIRGN